MNESSPSPSFDDDEISLLDLLVTLSDNLKLLLLGPVVAGMLAYGIAFMVPKTFESEAIIKLPTILSTSNEALVTLLQSARALDPIAQDLGMVKGEEDLTSARKSLKERIQVSVGKKDGLITVKAQGETAAQAQQLAQRLISQAMLLTKPQAEETKRLEAKLATHKFELQAAQNAIRELESKGQSSGSLAPVLLNVVQGANAQILAIESQLLGMTDDDVVQPPALPDRHLKPRKSIIAVIAALATGFALLLFVFVRQAMRNAAADPENASKLAHIKRQLGLKG